MPEIFVMATLSPNLLTLPTELLLEIIAFLPPASVASLSLVSKHLFTVIDPTVFRSLAIKDKQSYIQLLEILQKDRPHLIFCTFCMSLHDGTPVPPEEIDLDDYFCVVHAPVPPTGGLREVVINGKLSHVKATMVRHDRLAGTLRGQGMCNSRFAFAGKVLLSFTEEDAGMEFSATVFYDGGQDNSGGPGSHSRRGWHWFTHLTTYKIVLSIPLRNDAPRFENLRLVAETLGIRCCNHCPGGAVVEELVCKMAQMLGGRRVKGCACVNKSGYKCRNHLHEGNCECPRAVKIKVVGGFAVEIQVWRYKIIRSAFAERRRRRIEQRKLLLRMDRSE